ncbi:MAG TPA: hypothetical protein VNW06_02080, partial [Cytophagaceae bacterium]|nr:hypothetical protein [Cytophagaceae bacterium]
AMQLYPEDAKKGIAINRASAKFHQKLNGYSRFTDKEMAQIAEILLEMKDLIQKQAQELQSYNDELEKIKKKYLG